MDSIYEERNRRFEELSKKRELEAKSKLDKAKAQAKIDGKEPFDINIVLKYFPPYVHEAEELYNNPRKFNSRAKALEERYYTTYYNLMTLKEFGEKMCEMREYGAFD